MSRREKRQRFITWLRTLFAPARSEVHRSARVDHVAQRQDPDRAEDRDESDDRPHDRGMALAGRRTVRGEQLAGGHRDEELGEEIRLG